MAKTAKKKALSLTPQETIAKHWKITNEQKVKARYKKTQDEKRKRDFKSEREVAELVTRKIPFEYLAKDWLEEQKVQYIVKVNKIQVFSMFS